MSSDVNWSEKKWVKMKTISRDERPWMVPKAADRTRKAGDKLTELCIHSSSEGLCIIAKNGTLSPLSLFSFLSVKDPHKETSARATNFVDQ
jgi:hypothetical protein